MVRCRDASERLGALVTVVRVPVLMAYNEHPDIGVHVPVDHRIRKTSERRRTSVFTSQLTDVRKLLEKFDDALKLQQEAAGEPAASLAPIEPNGLRKILIRAFVK